MARRLAGLALAALLFAACAQGAAPAVDVTKGEIRADLREHAIALTSSEVRAGTVTLQVRNRGSMAHNFIVIRTDTPAGGLPLDRDTQKAGEEGRVGGIDELAPGATQNLRLELQPGRYVIICNIPTHYQLGMYTELRVN